MRHLPLFAASFLLLAACGGGDDDPGSVDASGNPSIDGGVAAGPVVVLETTLGDLVVELDDDSTPNTTANFLSYVDSDWYDGTLIHRVQADWVIQGGGYTTGLAPKTAMAPIDLEIGNRTHVHGAISMARTMDPNSADSQWFIVDWPEQGTPPQPAQLDGNYAAFGVLIEGFDVLAAITAVTVHDENPLQNVPDSEIVITSAYQR
jgi:cyclophilin family peptidyl-prolyl cis-trans isomerase